MEQKEKAYEELLDELDDGNHRYSFFRRFIESFHPDPRILVQMKCLEKFKWEISKEIGREITWNEASFLWVQDGYAEIFADVYDPDDPCVCRIYETTLRKQGRLK